VQRNALRLVNAHHVPGALQEPLLSGVNALAAQAPACVPVVPVVVPPPAAAAPPPPGRAHGHEHKHGKHGKHGGEGD
jgi:hypothetical protein